MNVEVKIGDRTLDAYQHVWEPLRGNVILTVHDVMGMIV